MSVPPFGIRMQPEVRDRIEAEAKSNNRSMNAEILARLSLPQLSLRDWFAGQALNGIVAGLCAAVTTEPPSADFRLVFSDAARDAYKIANSMLSEREKAAS